MGMRTAASEGRPWFGSFSADFPSWHGLSYVKLVLQYIFLREPTTIVPPF